MRRSLVGVVLVVTAAGIGAVVHGQQARSTDPGFLRRNFSPVTYLKASNPRADAKLGFGSALTGRTLVMSRDGNTLAVAAPEDRKSTRLNSSHLGISYADFFLKNKKVNKQKHQ